MKNAIKAVPLVLALLAAGAVAACGGGDDSGTAEEPVSTSAGAFSVLAEAPKDHESSIGSAELERSGDGTVARIELAGLRPDTQYASHLHAGGCDQPDPGGPHFKFDLNGSDMPPNEIHLPFTSDVNGRAGVEATSDLVVPDGEGRAIVVHLADAAEGDVATHGHGNDKDKGGRHKPQKHDAAGKEPDGEAHDEGKENDGAGGKGHQHQPKILCADVD